MMSSATSDDDSVEEGVERQSRKLKKRRSSSLLLRKQPVGEHLFLNDIWKENLKDDDSSSGSSREGGCWRKAFPCVDSMFSLRAYMMVTLGSIHALTILFVTVGLIATSIVSGDRVKNISFNRFDDISKEIHGTTARYVAETVTPKLIPKDLIRILYKATQDRFMGYPHFPGYEEDELVPFWDIESQSNRYPIVGEPLPLDWKVEPNVNDENYMEHVQDRWHWYQAGPGISTETGSYYMQGICDPSVTEPEVYSYYPNCTEENNNIETGGVVAPTPTNVQIHRKASDLTPTFKALYEYHKEIKSLGIYFANGGSGASFRFPHHALHAQWNYDSIGCDWLLETPNPYDPSRSILADGQSRRQVQNDSICRPNGTHVSAPVLNPLERDWCRDQALHPDKVRVAGPFVDAFDNGVMVVTVGRAVYDILTSEFIGCIAVDMAFDSLDEVLKSSRLTLNAHVSIVRYDQHGTIVASSAWNDITSITPIWECDAGVAKRVYQSLRSLVDYSAYNNGAAVWNATEIRQQYEEFVYHDTHNDYHVAGFPIPPPPDDYDPDYVPEFMALVAVPTTEMYEGVHVLMGKVDGQVYQLVLLAAIVGFAALGLMVAAIVLVSHFLTSPLQYMNEVVSDIFTKNFAADHNQEENKDETNKRGSLDATNNDSVDDQNTTDQDKSANSNENHYRQYKPWKCMPKTEINQVLEQFQNMVSDFTSLSMAKSMKANARQMKNEFTIVKDFEKLYWSRLNEETTFEYNFDYKVPSKPLKRLHFGTISKDDDKWQRSKKSTTSREDEDFRAGSSSLFFWIVMLLVIPFLLMTIAMSGVVISRISLGFTGLIDDTKGHFVDLEKTALTIFVGHRANLASAIMQRPVRDLHLLTRYASWLLFDAVKRADSLTQVVSNVELAMGEPVCDCSTAYLDDTCSRREQKLTFMSQSQDTWPNGDRNSTGYPDVAYSPETVSWWRDVRTLPGSEAGSLASGYETSYSRVRALSAIPILQLLYDRESGNNVHISSYMGFEADGSLLGYNCNVAGLVLASHFVARSLELAELLPEICPVGKFGYDTRCREWYHYGKREYEKDGIFLYVTPPYLFASMRVGQTSTAPLVDPVTNKYVGQAAVDFLLSPLLDSLDEKQTPLRHGGFPILITAASEMFINDTIVGPGFNFSNPQPIADVVFKDDPNCNQGEPCENWQTFEDIVNKMKGGDTGTAEFTRIAEGDSVQNVNMAYAPVSTVSFHPVNSSDFSRGVKTSEHVIFSLALAQTEQGLLEPFDIAEEVLDGLVTVVLGVLITIIVLSSLCVVCISYRVALSITKPMLYLLQLIGRINRMDSYDNAPEIGCDERGRSLEIVNVSKIMESLYQVIRSANSAFFTGDIEQAHRVLTDTLMLYRRLDNKKGISIACNNLGNMMVTMYRTMEATGETHICGFSKRQIVSKGMGYFHEAIHLGEKAYDAYYDRQGWSPSCLEFMQHLSNRYFNRAIFLLTVKNCHENPKDLEELGIRDLQIARDLDLEIIEEENEAGWSVRSIGERFDVSLSRLRGHLTLQEQGYPDDWDINEHLDEAFNVVKKELKKSKVSALFTKMSPMGRMQQIETELMRYKMLKGDTATAAKIAIRMLVEDENMLLDASIKAIEVLESYVKSTEFIQEEGSNVEKIVQHLREYEHFLTTANEENSLLRCSSQSKSTKSDITALSSRWSCSFRESQRGDFTMETF